MRVVVDIETNALVNPTKIWCVVFKDIDTGKYTIFRNLMDDGEERERVSRYLKELWDNPNSLLIGHNLIEFDVPVLNSLLKLCPQIDPVLCIDTLIVSRMADYSRDEGHSLEALGLEVGLEKKYFKDFSKWSQEMEDYCVRDVDVCHLIYNRYRSYCSSCHEAIKLEQQFQVIVNDLHTNGFAFNKLKAEKLLTKIKEELNVQDTQIEKSFPPRLKLLREIHPRLTSYGTLHKGDFRWVKDGDLSEFNGGPFSRCEWQPFNPASHRQIVDAMYAAGWRPTSKTKTHIEAERDLSRDQSNERLLHLRKYGWKVNEENLATLPISAPAPARHLARRILLESRRRTLVEWTTLVSNNGRIHGQFRGIGAWTHRMAHQEPNTANIPNEFDMNGKLKLYGKEMRALWCAPP